MPMQESPLDWLEHKEDMGMALERSLTGRERRIVSWLFGLEGERLDRNEISARSGLKPERVRQIANQALRKMQDYIENLDAPNIQPTPNAQPKIPARKIAIRQYASGSFNSPDLPGQMFRTKGALLKALSFIPSGRDLLLDPAPSPDRLEWILERLPSLSPGTLAKIESIVRKEGDEVPTSGEDEGNEYDFVQRQPVAEDEGNEFAVRAKGSKEVRTGKVRTPGETGPAVGDQTLGGRTPREGDPRNSGVRTPKEGDWTLGGRTSGVRTPGEGDIKTAFRDEFSVRHPPGRSFNELYGYWKKFEKLREWFLTSHPGEPFSLPALANAVKEERARRREQASPQPL